VYFVPAMRFLSKDGVKRYLFHPFTLVFIAALVVRAFYLWAAVGQIGAAALLTLSPDVSQYVSAASAIAGHFRFDTDGVVIFGPGYPAFLGAVIWILGMRAVALAVVHIILSSLGAALLTLFAYRLTHNRSVAIVAGVINAVSLTSVALSAAFLSDTLFVVLVLIGLLALTTGFEQGRFRWYVLAGVILSAALLARSVAMFLLVIVAVMALVYPTPPFGASMLSRKRMLTGAALACLIMLAVGTAWTIRNHSRYGFAQIAFSVPHGISRLTCLAETDGTSDAITQCVDQWTIAAQQASGEKSFFGRYNTRAMAEFWSVARNRPFHLARTYLDNVKNNITCESEMQYAQLPQWRPGFETVTRVIYKKGLQYRAIVLALAGVVILLYRRQYRLVAMAGVIGVCFAASAGFSLWQGSRIFYPGQIAWAVLGGYALVAGWTSIRIFIRGKTG
jgi:hypothetical protein